jgi:hypothetical protein
MVTKKSKGKDYNAIAKQMITRPSLRKRRPKFLVYSRNKKGKSTFCLSAPQVLVIDPEFGTDEMKKKDPHVWHISKWEQFADIEGFLRSGAQCPMCEGKDAHTFDWLAVDGLTKVHKLALNFVMRVEEEKSLDRQPGFVQQKDYGKANELLRQMMSNLHGMPQGVIYTAQERMIVEGEFADEDEEVENPTAQFVPDLPKGIRSEANAIVDVIGRLYIVNIEDSEGKKKAQRRLWIGPSEVYDTGYRSDWGPLPDYLKNPSVNRLVKLIRTGSAK